MESHSTQGWLSDTRPTHEGAQEAWSEACAQGSTVYEALKFYLFFFARSEQKGRVGVCPAFLSAPGKTSNRVVPSVEALPRIQVYTTARGTQGYGHVPRRSRVAAERC